MKYSVDRIEDNIVVLENIKTKEIKEIKKNELSFDVDEKDILTYKNKIFQKDNNEKLNRLRIIQEKLNRLRK